MFFIRTDGETLWFVVITIVAPLCLRIREIFRVLDLMKMDMINLTIDNLRLVLHRQGVEYERATFQSILDKTPSECSSVVQKCVVFFLTKKVSHYFFRRFGQHDLVDQDNTRGAAVHYCPHRANQRSGQSGARAVSGPQHCSTRHPHMGLREGPAAWGESDMNLGRTQATRDLSLFSLLLVKRSVLKPEESIFRIVKLSLDLKNNPALKK